MANSYVSDYEMLKSIEADGKVWMNRDELAVQYINGTWHVFYGWTMTSKGITLHTQRNRTGLIGMLSDLAKELE